MFHQSASTPAPSRAAFASKFHLHGHFSNKNESDEPARLILSDEQTTEYSRKVPYLRYSYDLLMIIRNPPLFRYSSCGRMRVILAWTGQAHSTFYTSTGSVCHPMRGGTAFFFFFFSLSIRFFCFFVRSRLNEKPFL